LQKSCGNSLHLPGLSCSAGSPDSGLTRTAGLHSTGYCK
jgi:hypothetical protein